MVGLVKEDPVNRAVWDWLGRKDLTRCECGNWFVPGPDTQRASYGTPDGSVEIALCDACGEAWDEERAGGYRG